MRTAHTLTVLPCSLLPVSGDDQVWSGGGGESPGLTRVGVVTRYDQRGGDQVWLGEVTSHLSHHPPPRSPSIPIRPCDLSHDAFHVTSPPLLWTEWVTHACVTHAFARFATRVVKSNKSGERNINLCNFNEQNLSITVCRSRRAERRCTMTPTPFSWWRTAT